MGLFRKSRKYERTIKLINDTNITNIRSKVKILMVDDEEFGALNPLIQRKYDIYYKKDMSYAIEAEPFDIVILDIKGIASSLGSNMEGFSLAKEVKKAYPNKKVLCYSSSVKKEIAPELLLIDGFILKDTEIDQLANKLDELIKEYISIDYQWSVLKKRLQDNKIEESDIEEIHKEFIASFRDNRFSSLDNILIDKLENIQLLLNILQSIYNFINLLAIK